MCGIAGLVGGGSSDESHDMINRMTGSLSHRGPDGSGTWLGQRIALGHTRLAILDLTTAGIQPMVSRNGRFVLTYNGEIYNFKDIRNELLREGASFLSSTDSEVLLEAISYWGIESAICRFNGMFAFAVWDHGLQQLFLGRDRYGVKPLYYTQFRDTFAFASEHRAFREIPGFRSRLDIEAVAEYLTFQNIFSDRTFTADVRVFPPGHWGVVNETASGHELHLHRYWDFSFGSAITKASVNEYAEELGRLLDQAVQRQLVSDVEVGSFLSGGLDSGSIVHSAASTVPDLKTFTVGYATPHIDTSELGQDERLAAELVSAMLGTDHFESVIGPQHVPAATAKLMIHLEDPRVGQSYPNFFASRLASSFVKVTLAGTGGDEVLGGYPWRYPSQGVEPEQARAWHLERWQRVLRPQELRALLGPVADDIADFSAETLHSHIFARGLEMSRSPQPNLDAALYFEAKTFLPGLLAVEDRLSMAFGMETRVPFLDNDLVDFAMAIPATIRLSENSQMVNSSSGVARSKSGKAILRQAMEGCLPPQITSAQKQGFSAPDENWFAGPLRQQIIDATKALSHEFFDTRFALDHWDLEGTGKIDRGVAWSLLVASLATQRLLLEGGAKRDHSLNKLIQM